MITTFLSVAPTAVVMDDLTDRQREMAFERQWWKYAAAEETAIRHRFGCSATRYYQELNGLIDRPEALIFEPMLVKRLSWLRAIRDPQPRTGARLRIT